MLEANKNMILASSQYNQLVPKLKETLGSLLGVDSSQIDINTHFVEMGVESLFLLQFSRSIEKKFDIKVPFRLLLEDFSTIDALANHIDQQMPTIEAATEELTPTEPLQEATLQPLSIKTADVRSPKEEGVKPVVERLIAQQLQVMSKQLELLQKGSSVNQVSATSNILQSAVIQKNILEKNSNHTPLSQSTNLSKNNKVEYARKSVSATVRQGKKDTLDGLNSHQKQHLDSLIARISKRTPESKRLTQSARTFLANPRAITGFRPSIKEMLYPIHAQRGVNGRIWDVDGHEYIDISMGFGALLFGHSPSFVTEAIQEHIKHGIQHGPQSRLTGQVAELFCELTGQERATFCNSGTDAVMGSIRIARAVTGRSKIAMFAGSYHGTLDEVLVTGIANQDGTLRTVPVAPGIPQHIVEKVITLDYGNPQSLDIIAANAHELAAVLVEPLQSRQPDLHPKEFLQKLRQLTQEKGIVLIFDEVITGFRMHPGGIQALWNIQADIITYGKSVGGGLPIGVVAGKAAFMDALDGGFWNYGDASYPEAETTVFAGTFFKHPLVMAVALAVLNHIKERGQKLQEELAQKTAKLAENLNSYFQQKQLPIKIDYFGSLFIFTYPPHLTWMNLLFYYLLEKGVYVWEGRTCFLSTAHTDEDIEQVIRAVKESIEKMQEAEFLPATKLSSPETKSVRSFPLTAQQQELWIMAKMGDEVSRAYNESTIIHVRGLFNVSVMRQAIQEIINRHEALRTTFSAEGDYQLIHSTLIIDIPLIDFSSSNSNQSEALLTEWLAREAQQNFDLEQGPLLRAQMIKLEEQHHLIVLTNHHIIADGWSVGVLMQELSVIYSATCQGNNYQLPQPKQYSEYAQWQTRQLNSPEMATVEAYWLKQFTGYIPALELPTDYPRPLINKFIGDQKNIIIGRELKNKLTSLSSECSCTLFTTLLAAYMVLIHQLTGQEDIVIGIPAAGQLALDSECLVGHCVNLLPLRSQTFADPVFTDYLKLVKKVLLDAYDYQAYPFINLIKSLNLPRNASRNPLMTAIFNLEKAETEPEFWGGKIQVDTNATGAAKFDISLNIIQTDDELLLECSYNTDLFTGQTIERWLAHYLTLLNDIVVNSKQQVSKLQLLTEFERQQLLVNWNRTITNYSPDKCIHHLFEEQVEQSPDAIAVVFDNQELTYKELNQRANQLGHYLQQLGVKPEMLVGICVERSLAMVIGILGILKAGGAYVPIDPAYPQERLAFMLEDAQISLLLTEERLLKILPEHQAQVVCLNDEAMASRPVEAIAKQPSDNLVLSSVTANNLAYVIYTSGSTGKPKGVLVNHANVVRLFLATQSWYQFNQQDVWTLFHSYAFDFSVWELWGALFSGGRLVVLPYWVSREPEAFYNLLCKEQVTVLNQTPSAFRQLMRAEESLNNRNELRLRLVIFGGEALELQSLKPWFERHGDKSPQLVNMYGITETTVHVTYRPLSIADLNQTANVIGNPIPDLQVYILNKHLQPVPLGVAGEMYVGGAGVARGYLNRPEMTAERFIRNIFSDEPQARLYKTGDLARYLPNRDIEYLGRIDNQVKVRGFRIELGEIEAALLQHPAVREAVVLASGDRAEKHLVGYVVPKEQLPIVNILRNFLSHKLPEHMVPSTFVILEGLPLTLNGKVDYRALPAPDTARPELDEAFVAPRTPEEKVLAEIWAQILGLEKVGIYDNFFALGGDSIRSIQVQSLAQKQSLGFSLQQLFQHQTIDKLVREIQSVTDSTAKIELIQPFSLISPEDKSRLPESVEDAYPLTMLQAGMIFHSEHSQDAIYHDIFSFHLEAPLDVQSLQNAIQRTVNRHGVLRTSFQFTNFSEPLQLVHSPVEVPLQVEDLCHLSLVEQDEVLSTWIETEKKRHFDWTRPPLLRFQIHRRTEKTFQLTLSFHHAILDGWSVASLLTQLFEDTANAKSTPAIAFSDFVALERQALASEKCQNYWMQKLSNSTATMLPHSHSSGTSSREQVAISSEVCEGLKQLAKLANVPLKTVLLAAHLRVLSLFTNQSDIVTGLVSNGRPEDTDGEKILGLFLNTLPFRLNLQQGTWVDLARSTFQAETELLPYRRYPLVEIQRNLGGQTLFNTAFNFVHFHVYQDLLKRGDIQVIDGEFFEETNLTLLANFGLDPSSSSVQLNLQAVSLSNEQIETIGGYYARTLAAMAKQPLGRFEEHSLLSAQEQQQLLDWNNTQVDYPQDLCIHQLFEAQVEQSPDAIAVVFEDQQLTYQELNQRANQLAHYLQKLGVGPEVLVGICVERTLDMVIGLLGILKAGGAYVPLDPAYPQERLTFILQDAQVPVLITQQMLLQALPQHEARVICLDSDWQTIRQQSQENPVSAATANTLAYVIYTSGSTGRPKGVAIEHHSTVTLLDWAKKQFTPEELAGVLASTSICFDLSVFELFVPLTWGGKVILAENALALPNAQQVSLINTVPSAIAQLLKIDGIPTSVRTINLAGEPLQNSLVQQIYQLGYVEKVFNLYGPSEDTTYSTFALINKGSTQTPPIGRPIANTQIYLLNERLQPVPVGVLGELYITGDGLARGYLNRPELTAEKFIPNPFEKAQGSRLYKTGDLGRYHSDGNIEFLGRIDHQVKVRGFRIELGEIEAVFTQHPAIQQAVVVAREDEPGEKRLVAYFVAKEQPAPSTSELRHFLSEKLPKYMIPSAFVQLEALPLTPNGKLDRKALPAPDTARPELDKAFVAPRTPIEEVIAGIWTQILGLEQVGSNDNFFELGGHSLLATQVISRLRDAFQLELPLRYLFESPTIAELAQSIEELMKAGQGIKEPPIQTCSREINLPLSFAQQRLWFIDQLESGSPLYNDTTAVRLTGVLNIAALDQSLNEIVRRHEALRTTFTTVDGQPVQVITPVLTLTLPIVDLRSLSPNTQELEIERFATEESQRPCNLAAGPLLRVILLQLDKDNNVILFTIHHIVSDGWSMGLLVQEAATLYEAFNRGQPSPLPELPIQYADFANWQQQWLVGEVLEKQLSYWQRHLSGAPTMLKLPMARPRPTVQTFGVGSTNFVIPKALTEAIKTLSHQEGVTLFMTLLATLQTLLSRYTHQEDIVIGTDVANRNRSNTEQLIGFFVNLLVLRTNLSNNPSFRELLRRVREVTLGAYTHQDLPFAKLVDALKPERKLGHTPLFQILFVLQNTPKPTVELSELTLTPMEINTGMARFDLALFVTETEQELVGTWKYSTDLFDAYSITLMSGHFETLLKNIVAQPDTRINSLEMLTEAENKHQSLEQKQRQAAKLSKFKTVKPKAISLPSGELIKTDFLQPENSLPLVIEPDVPDIELADWAKSHRDFIETQLLKYGAILFRNFNINSVVKFENVAGAICPNLFGEYGDLPREGVGGKVYGSTPYPNDKAILFHNESSHLQQWPMKIWFFCVQPSEVGGETPIVDCRKIYQLIDPKLRQRFADKQLMYVRNFTEGLDVSWQEFFRTTQKAVVEDYCRQAGIDFEWSDNSLKTRSYRQAIAKHPRTDELVFFNQLQLHHISYLDHEIQSSLLSVFGEQRLPRHVYYGDGSPIEQSVIQEISEIYQQSKVSFTWQKGDILMLDNMLAAHGRNPYVGSRKIVVAMGEMINFKKVAKL